MILVRASSGLKFGCVKMSKAVWTSDDETMMTLDWLSIHCSRTSLGDAMLDASVAERPLRRCPTGKLDRRGCFD